MNSQWTLCRRNSLVQLCCASLILFKYCIAQCQSDKVFSLPITNVTLANGASIRGTPITVGTPPLTIAVAPKWPLNDTWIYGSGGPCSYGTSSPACITRRGGLYNSTASGSSAIGAPESASDGSSVPSEVWYTDTIGLTHDIQLTQYPFGTPSQDIGDPYDSLNILGLTSESSSFLTALQQQGHISSKVWSMWWGQNGATEPATQDGTIVFGGYDAAKITGPNITAQLNPTGSCPSGMLMNVENVTLSFPNGTSAGLITADQGGFAVCIEPDWPMAMDLMSTYFNNFEMITQTQNTGRSMDLNFYGMLYPLGEAFEGDLILDFTNGFQSTVKNSQLVIPDQAIDAESGLVVVTNSSMVELLINSLQNDTQNNLPRLGKPFLSGVYLLVDLDHGTYTLWPAQPTQDERLVAMDGSCFEPQTSSTSPSGSTSSTLSGGAIAGIVIGSIAACLLAIALSLLIVKKRSQKARRNAALGNNQAGGMIQRFEEPNSEPQEVDSQLQRAEADSQPGGVKLEELPSYSAATRPPNEVHELQGN